MKKINTTLTGENLARFLNIQRTIQITQRRVSLGVSPDVSLRMFHEDILPLAGTTEHMDVSLTPSLSLLSGELPGHSSKDLRELEEHRKAEFGFGYPDLRDERSDWMLDELKTTKKEAKKKLSRGTECSQCKMVRAGTVSSVEVNNLKRQEPGDQDLEEINMHLHDQISPEEEQRIHERICNKYGKESGRRYLLVRSMTMPEKKIEPWTTTRQTLAKPQTYSKDIAKCRKTESKHKGKVVCPQISEDVTKKMETLVEIMPPCSTEGIQGPKRWKDVLRKSSTKSHNTRHVSVKAESQSSIISEEKSDYTPCSCGVYHCDCDLIKVKCKAPKIKKICDMGNYDVDETNNYLITCREHLQDKQNQDRRVTVLQQHASKVASRVTRESVYLQSAHDQAESELMTCLMKVMPPQGQEVSDTGYNHVQELANAIAEHKMINEHEWRVWRYTHAKMENMENSDELDSLDSDIASSSISDDELSECNIKFSKGLPPSRIPYFKETFELANTFFYKIDAKLEKLIAKNHDKRNMLLQKPYTHMLNERLKLLRHDNRLFNQVCRQMHAYDFYGKQLVPFSERKRKKRVTANEKKVELNKKQNRRKFIEGLQLGKIYRRPKRSFIYTEKENYKGFSPYRQKILRQTGTDKFRKCNLVGSDLSGRRLTKKVIHNDYRLIRRLFDHQLKRNKDSLWDPGMKARLEEYLGVFREVHRPAEEGEDEVDEDISDVSFGTNQRRPRIEEQKTQTALPSGWSYCKRSSGKAAETFASMIRSLRSDATSHLGLTSRNLANPSGTPRTPRTCTSFEKPTVQSSSMKPVSGRPRTWPASLDLRTSRLDKPSQVPFSKPDTRLKGRPFTPGSFSSFGISETDSSIPQMKHLRIRQASPGKHLVKSVKTLPPIQGIKPNTSDLPQKYPWKSSKTVR